MHRHIGRNFSRLTWPSLASGVPHGEHAARFGKAQRTPHLFVSHFCNDFELDRNTEGKAGHADHKTSR